MIRPATVEDATALARLHAEAFIEPWDAAAMVDFLSAIGALALMDEAGFILVRTVAGEAEVLTLAVAPDARRKGVGRALVEAAAAVLAERADSLFLEVAADNAAARALYAATGFEPVGRRKGYYRRAGGPGMDALLLRKTLTPSPA